MSSFFTIGSLILGLAAWIIPFIAIRPAQKKRIFSLSVLSLSACIISLTLQILEIRHRVNQADWSALMDTINMLSWVVVIFIIITIILNLIILNLWKSK